MSYHNHLLGEQKETVRRKRKVKVLMKTSQWYQWYKHKKTFDQRLDDFFFQRLFDKSVS